MKMHAPTHRVSAFAVIFDDQRRVLVSRRPDNGYYNLPGGGVEPHESVTEGLVRELREETSLQVCAGRLVGVYSKPQKHEIVLVFEATIVGGALQTSSEAEEHRWLSAAELDAAELLPKHRDRIRDALAQLPHAVIADQRSASVASLRAETGAASPAS